MSAVADMIRYPSEGNWERDSAGHLTRWATPGETEEKRVFAFRERAGYDRGKVIERCIPEGDVAVPTPSDNHGKPIPPQPHKFSVKPSTPYRTLSNPVKPEPAADKSLAYSPQPGENFESAATSMPKIDGYDLHDILGKGGMGIFIGPRKLP